VTIGGLLPNTRHANGGGAGAIMMRDCVVACQIAENSTGSDEFRACRSQLLLFFSSEQ
jgi:hypothetical protein